MSTGHTKVFSLSTKEKGMDMKTYKCRCEYCTMVRFPYSYTKQKDRQDTESRVWGLVYKEEEIFTKGEYMGCKSIMEWVENTHKYYYICFGKWDVFEPKSLKSLRTAVL